MLMKPSQDYYQITNSLTHILTTSTQIKVCANCVRFFLLGTEMTYNQIERLKKDTEELSIYAKKLFKKGDTPRAEKILKKREFILRTIEMSA